MPYNNTKKEERFGIERVPSDHEGTTEVYQRFPVGEFNEIIDFMEKHRYRSRNQAINDLIQIALIVVDKKEKIGDPKLVAEIKALLHEGGLVDFFERMNPKDFEIIWSIAFNEAKIRGFVKK